MINIINTAIYYIKVKRANPKCSHHKEKFLSIYFILYLYEVMGDR